MIDTKRLRQKILDLAIRGKLVPQDPADEPASVLLERIHAEKLQMVADGKLKKKDVAGDSVIYRGEDNLHYEKVGDGEPVCIEDELPFALPEGWCWSRIGAITSEPQYGTSKKSDKTGLVPVLRMGNITRTGSIDWKDLAYSSDAADIAKYRLSLGDILFNRTNSKEWVGKTALFDGQHESIYAGYIVRFRPLIVDASFVNHAMCTPYEREWCNQVKTDGVNQSNINVQKLKRFLIPIPPLSEQHRIVAVLDDLLAYVDTIKREQAELDELIAKTRSKVLDLAIRGKLVPQDPEDESASVLLERIHAEKLQMVADGKLKKKDIAGDSVIYQGDDNSYYEKTGKDEKGHVDTEPPFVLPKGWAWTRLASLFLVNPRNEADDDTMASFIPMASIESGYTGVIHPEVKPWSQIKKGFTHFADGDVVFSKISPCFENGKYFIGSNLINGIGAGTTELFVLRPINASLDPQYVYAYLRSRLFIKGATKTFMGTVGQQRVKREYVEQALLPVPPRIEQQRIIQAIELFLQALDL